MLLKDTSVGTIEYAGTYAKSNHQHPFQTVDTISNSDSVDGSYGTVDLYARNNHSHPINIQTNTSIELVVNRVGNNGTSAYYSRRDHIHLQQLIYDGNVTATKFIKAGGTASEVLCANSDTTSTYSKFSRTYNSGPVDQITPCAFPIGTSNRASYIQFQVQFNINAMQTIDLVPNYSVNGIVGLYAEYTAWIHMVSGSGNVTVTVNNQSPFSTNLNTPIGELRIGVNGQVEYEN
ncbi:MAG: hypothetical protein EZS28_006578 [Streblomastix strix]|uniref:Uncharacterized protein n=1 Tax=Streblomastix strix TaxID=222440 RepID=A0A5J4WSK1_9EUKA|nr:MAG: hypothetical protein EZS28_006578 [Streblomastix strix]